MPAVTLRDVALASGVSTYTVSKVVGGQAKAARIAPATVERVLAKAAELGYVPNAGHATYVRSARARLAWCFVSLRIWGWPSVTPLRAHFSGHNVTAQEQGILPVVVYPAVADAKAIDPTRLLWTAGLTGYCCGVPSQPGGAAAHDAHTLPVVAMWYRDVPEHMGYVDIDHEGGARLAVEHLLALGHRRIAYFGPGLDYDNVHFAMRYHGYRSALEAAGIIVRPEWHARTNDEVMALMQRTEPITAVFSVQDSRAASLTAALTATGCQRTRDLSVAGFDNMVNADLLGGADDDPSTY